MTLALDAMMFAREVHKDQKRKYTDDPYFCHLLEVAGIAASALIPHTFIEECISISFLHDCVEDQGVSYETLHEKFGKVVAEGVMWLSDLEEGNRATRKQLSRERLSRAPGWIQTIKCADLISNTQSITLHDPKFAVTYLAEKRAILEVLTKADERLKDIAWEMCK